MAFGAKIGTAASWQRLPLEVHLAVRGVAGRGTSIELLLEVDLALVALCCIVWMAKQLPYLKPLYAAFIGALASAPVPAELIALALFPLAYAIAVWAFGDLELALSIAKWTLFGIALALLILAALRVLFFVAPMSRQTAMRLAPRVVASTRPIGTASLQAMFAAIAATTAVAAYQTYKANNGNAMLIALEERDRQLRTHYMLEGGRELLQVFSDRPEVDPDNCDHAFVRRWATGYVSETSGFKGDWKSIDELDRLLWSTEPMKNKSPEYQLARALMMHAIDYLYIIHDAYHAHMKDYFSVAERDMWGAYLDDLGDSPYFLWALKDGERYGYMMRDVRSEIVSYLRGNTHRRCIFEAIYPELLTEGVSAR